jgi:hypothetical protein
VLSLVLINHRGTENPEEERKKEREREKERLVFCLLSREGDGI